MGIRLTSADLIELGRTPVAVVCSGAKSILDLPLTLEVLETQGVPIVGIGTGTLPAFYSRSSGLPIDASVETPEQAALNHRRRRSAWHDAWHPVHRPVPAQHELPQATADAAITQATEEAEAQGIHGKEVTPYVLARVAELTEGRSRSANTALLINNARTAAKIARALAGC